VAMITFWPFHFGSEKRRAQIFEFAVLFGFSGRAVRSGERRLYVASALCKRQRSGESRKVQIEKVLENAYF
jgi:hypothetical protein